MSAVQMLIDGDVADEGMEASGSRAEIAAAIGGADECAAATTATRVGKRRPPRPAPPPETTETTGTKVG